jgi:hypothetical protein
MKVTKTKFALRALSALTAATLSLAAPVGFFISNPLKVNAVATGTFDLATGTWLSGGNDYCSWDVTSDVLTVNGGADIEITTSEPTANIIVVNGTASITLKNVSI